MIKREDKRGQFYLIAAIVIIAVIIGFASYSSYTKRQAEVKIYDLGEELGFEGAKVIDYGIIDQDEEVVGAADLTLIDHFTNLYDLYAGDDKEIYYVIGNQQGDIEVHTYQDIIVGTISITFGGASPELSIDQRQRTEFTDTDPELNVVGNQILVTLDENNYEFELQQGENFYFVITQEVEGNRYVTTG